VTLLALAVSGRGAVDPGKPVLHADDDALLRGRAAFETLRVYRGRPFRLEIHLERLAASADRIGLPPVDQAELRSLTSSALGAAGNDESVLRLLWTAGRDGGEPVALALVSELPPQLEEWRRRGIAVISLLGVRAEAPWLLGGVKSTSYAVNMAAEAEARRRGAEDAIFVDADGIVLEGPVTNVWWRTAETLFTPSLDLGILAGVTRGAVLELAGQAGYEVDEGAFPLARLVEADEVFTSSSVRELLPVVGVDGRPIAEGRPGPAARDLQAALRVVAERPAVAEFD
jgi:4-amino-4-deoxychorismate lyase